MGYQLFIDATMAYTVIVGRPIFLVVADRFWNADGVVTTVKVFENLAENIGDILLDLVWPGLCSIGLSVVAKSFSKNLAVNGIFFYSSQPIERQWGIQTHLSELSFVGCTESEYWPWVFLRYSWADSCWRLKHKSAKQNYVTAVF